MNFCKHKGFYKSYKRAKTNVADSTTRLAAAQKKINDCSTDPTSSTDRKEALKKILELATAANTVKAIPKKGKNFFSLYKTLLGDNAQVNWSRIVDAQIGAAPWTDLQGNMQDIAHEHYVQSFKQCVTFHLLSVFSNNAEERQKYYISHNIKKPQKIPIRNFADRIEELNSYIPLLLRLINSP